MLSPKPLAKGFLIVGLGPFNLLARRPALACLARFQYRETDAWEKLVRTKSRAPIMMHQCDERVIRKPRKTHKLLSLLWVLPSEGAYPRSAASIRLMLRVKRLEVGARAPVVAHPGEDLGYDLFALEATLLAPRATVRVRTGISVEARHPATGAPLGLLVRDRSSMAARGIATTAGVIDAGYRGEIQVLMTNLGQTAVELKAGEKIAQMVPVPVLTGPVQEVETLEDSARAEKGFGSSGR